MKLTIEIDVPAGADPVEVLRQQLARPIHLPVSVPLPGDGLFEVLGFGGLQIATFDTRGLPDGHATFVIRKVK